MTKSDLIREIGELGARSPRILSDLAGWLNRGQRAIAQRRNWSFLHSITSVTITSGTTSAALPATFKELAPQQSPITYTSPTAQFPTPVHVKSRAELERMTPGVSAYVANYQGGYSPFYVFLESGPTGWTINSPQGYPQAANATYALSCFLFPADLSLGTDHNALTDDAELAEALIEWVKAKAFLAEDSTDPRGIASQQLFEQHLRTAAAQDARKNLAGRAIRF